MYSELNDNKSRLSSLTKEGNLGGLEPIAKIASLTNFDHLSEEKEKFKSDMKDNTSFVLKCDTQKYFEGKANIYLSFEVNTRKIEIWSYPWVRNLMSEIYTRNIFKFESICQLNTLDMRFLIWNPTMKPKKNETKVENSTESIITAYETTVFIDMLKFLKDCLCLEGISSIEIVGYNSVINIIQDQISLIKKSFYGDYCKEGSNVDLWTVKPAVNMEPIHYKDNIKKGVIKNLDEYTGIYSANENEEVRLVFGINGLCEKEFDPTIALKNTGFIEMLKLFKSIKTTEKKEDVEAIKYKIRKFLRTVYYFIFKNLGDLGKEDKYNEIAYQMCDFIIFQNKCDYHRLKKEFKDIQITDIDKNKEIERSVYKNQFSNFVIVPFSVPKDEKQKVEIKSDSDKEEKSDSDDTNSNLIIKTTNNQEEVTPIEQIKEVTFEKKEEEEDEDFIEEGDEEIEVVKEEKKEDKISKKRKGKSNVTTNKKNKK